MDNAIDFPNTCPLDSDLSGGWRYPTFEQPEPGLDLVTSLDTKISGFRNHSGFKKLRIRMPDSPDTCARKPLTERKSCGLKNIRICVNWAYSLLESYVMFQVQSILIF